MKRVGFVSHKFAFANLGTRNQEKGTRASKKQFILSFLVDCKFNLNDRIFLILIFLQLATKI